MPIDFRQIIQSFLSKSGLIVPPDFLTHAHYVKYMRSLVDKGIQLECKRQFSNKISNHPSIEKKLKLCRFTLDSLEGEYKKIQQDSEYAQLCVSWVSVKSYYLLFNLLLIVDYLISGESNIFHRNHKTIIDRFKNYVEDRVLIFSIPEFNMNLPSNTFYNVYKAKPGDNLRQVSNERLLQILKKLVRYQVDDFQLKEKINNFRSRQAKLSRDAFLNSTKVNLFEFFYWYRIKANYRDLEFLDHQITDTDFKSFYDDYFMLTKAFHNCFQNLITELRSSRIANIMVREYP